MSVKLDSCQVTCNYLTCISKEYSEVLGVVNNGHLVRMVRRHLAMCQNTPGAWANQFIKCNRHLECSVRRCIRPKASWQRADCEVQDSPDSDGLVAANEPPAPKFFNGFEELRRHDDVQVPEPIKLTQPSKATTLCSSASNSSTTSCKRRAASDQQRTPRDAGLVMLPMLPSAVKRNLLRDERPLLASTSDDRHQRAP